MKLVIVESPAKAKTIEKYLGAGYKVMSSVGHIRDLPSKGMNIDIEGDFTPKYEINPDKKKVVAELKKAVKSADEVILASDEDREGEAIAWHLCHALGLQPATTKRIVFHEITKPAIEAAIASPRTVDQKLVDAQQARRVLDRVVGYELSPILWKKVQTGLSAGRVQSVAVKLIVEREQEIEAFEADSNFRLVAEFSAGDASLPAELNKKLPNHTSAREFLLACQNRSFKVGQISEKPGSKNPGAPFTTSTLQQEASRRLGYSVRQTMQLAQRLYEAGHITYMRTDSTNLSKQAMAAAASYIEQTYGKDYVDVKNFKTKNSSAQEAHEAIRPTNFTNEVAGADEQQKKIYNLIWRRALASQMAKAKTIRTELTIPVETRPEYFVAKGEVLVFDGFMRAYGGAKDDVILPHISEGDSLALNWVEARQTYAKPPARYSEASLVRKLEELGIGRPSTYAPTISTIQDRGYIEKADIAPKQRQVELIRLENNMITETEESENYAGDSNKLLPTPLANMVTTFLSDHFSQIMDYSFTSSVEAHFDEIADGKLIWNNYLKDFYQDFHPSILKAQDVSRAEVSNMRELGVDPKDGKKIFARMGRFGPMLQKGRAEDQEEKPEFAPMPKEAQITTITLEQALEMFKLPRILGQDDNGEEIKANIGRFGPYVQAGKLYASIKGHDPHTISLEEAKQLIADKLAAEAKKVIADWGKVKILRGPYGPYITDGKKNARIAKDKKPEDISETEATKLLAEAKPGRKRRPIKKK